MLRHLTDMGYDEEEKYDKKYVSPLGPWSATYNDAPDYPTSLCFSISCDDLDKAGAGSDEPGGTMGFCADACVTCIYKDEDDCRIEMEIESFGGEDGKQFDLDHPGYISFCGRELEKLGLDCDCEVGEYICLEGTVCLKSVSKSEFGESATLQITDLSYCGAEG